MASRASNWNHEELRKLVELWADVSIQAIMDSKQKNTRAYDKIKVRLGAAGFIRTVAQINAKIKHLRRQYHVTENHVTMHVTNNGSWHLVDFVELDHRYPI